MSTPGSQCRLLAGAAVVIGERYREPLTLAEVARTLGCSPRALQRAFGDAHTSFSEELWRLRLRAAAELLGGQALAIEVVARLAGFAGANSLNGAFRRRYGITAGEYRAQVRAARRRGLRDRP